MNLPHCETLLLSLEDSVLSITLNRPQKRNAMNRQMVEDIIATFSAIEHDRSIRAVILQGAGGHFCAGGDISDMNTTALDGSSLDPRLASWQFNRSFGRLISQVNNAPQVVIATVRGAVMGGGFGLVCASDVAIANHDARFALPETGLGIAPAQIAPFVVTRIGLTQARRLALLGEKIDGKAACDLGLVHFYSESEQAMQRQLENVLANVHRCAPSANALTKQLLLKVGHMELETLLDHAADCFSESICGEEGQEGSRAFLEKRPPCWALNADNDTEKQTHE